MKVSTFSFYYFFTERHMLRSCQLLCDLNKIIYFLDYASPPHDYMLLTSYISICLDEIPMVLCELNESALAYLNRDQFENALLLL